MSIRCFTGWSRRAKSSRFPGVDTFTASATTSYLYPPTGNVRNKKHTPNLTSYVSCALFDSGERYRAPADSARPARWEDGHGDVGQAQDQEAHQRARGASSATQTGRAGGWCASRTAPRRPSGGDFSTEIPDERGEHQRGSG